MIPQSGHCDDKFSAVRDVLLSNIDAGHDLGASIAVILDGKAVVDMSAGWKDRQQSVEFGNTLCCVYSAGKAITATLMMAAVERGFIDYEKRISDYWSAFGAEGKDSLTVGQALSHQTGLPGFAEPTDPAIWIDWDATVSKIASTAPLWQPGTQNGYSPQIFGFIAGEIYCRQTQWTVGYTLRQMNVDVHCGMTEDHIPRVGPMIKPPAAPDLGSITPAKKAAFLEKWSAPAGIDRQQWIKAEIPASNMHATARGLADVMQGFATGKVGGKDIASAEIRSAAMAEQIRGDDLILPFDLSWGCGVMRNTHEYLGPSPTAVGHYGFGGALTIADPECGLSFAYVPNKMTPALVADPRAMALVNATYEALS